MSKSHKTAGHYFDEIADQWEVCYRSSLFFAQRYGAFARVVERFSDPDGSALDYGCGPGVLTRLLVGRFERVVATDISVCMLRCAKQAFAEEPSVSVVDTAMLGEERFDLVLCSSVIEYAENLGDFLLRLHSHLKAEGVLLLSVPNRTGLMQMLYRSVAGFRKNSYISYQSHCFSKRSIHRLLCDNGFRVEGLYCPIGLLLLKAVGLGEIILCIARPSSSLL